MHRTRIDLPVSVREKVIPVLQGRLADSVDLFTQAKHAHWNVKGSSFIALHELFDEVAEIAAHDSDLIAERITALGGRADGTSRIAAAQSKLSEYPLELTNGMEHVAALTDRLAAFGKLVREAVDRTTEYGDADTADLFTEISRAMDKHLWLVEAHLQAER